VPEVNFLPNLKI